MAVARARAPASMAAVPADACARPPSQSSSPVASATTLAAAASASTRRPLSRRTSARSLSEQTRARSSAALVAAADADMAKVAAPPQVAPVEGVSGPSPLRAGTDASPVLSADGTSASARSSNGSPAAMSTMWVRPIAVRRRSSMSWSASSRSSRAGCRCEQGFEDVERSPMLERRRQRTSERAGDGDGFGEAIRLVERDRRSPGAGRPRRTRGGAGRDCRDRSAELERPALQRADRRCRAVPLATDMRRMLRRIGGSIGDSALGRHDSEQRASVSSAPSKLRRGEIRHGSGQIDGNDVDGRPQSEQQRRGVSVEHIERAVEHTVQCPVLRQHLGTDLEADQRRSGCRELQGERQPAGLADDHGQLGGMIVSIDRTATRRDEVTDGTRFPQETHDRPPPGRQGAPRGR